MDAIITAFGIDWRLVAIQIFNFVILVAVLWYLLYGPVLAMLEKRRGIIAKGVADAEEAGKQLADAEHERGRVIKAAHDEAANVALRGKEAADRKATEIVAAAEVKGNRTITDAEKEAELIKDQARKESEAEIAKTALLAAEKILKERA